VSETTFEHKFSVNDDVLFPSGDELKEGSIDEIIFEKRSYGNKDRIRYRVHPRGHGSHSQSVRAEEDLIAAQ
jgi:hypothetical protein